MKGWKTWLAGGIIIATGIYVIVMVGDYTQGSALIGVGTGIVGIGHKIEKNKL